MKTSKQEPTEMRAQLGFFRCETSIAALFLSKAFSNLFALGVWELDAVRLSRARRPLQDRPADRERPWSTSRPMLGASPFMDGCADAPAPFRPARDRGAPSAEGGGSRRMAAAVPPQGSWLTKGARTWRSTRQAASWRRPFLARRRCGARAWSLKPVLGESRRVQARVPSPWGARRAS